MNVKRPAESETHQAASLDRAALAEISEPADAPPMSPLAQPAAAQALLTVGVN
jgi:hypothetical protein